MRGTSPARIYPLATLNGRSYGPKTIYMRKIRFYKKKSSREKQSLGASSPSLAELYSPRQNCEIFADPGRRLCGGAVSRSPGVLTHVRDAQSTDPTQSRPTFPSPKSHSHLDGLPVHFLCRIVTSVCSTPYMNNISPPSHPRLPGPQPSHVRPHFHKNNNS